MNAPHTVAVLAPGVDAGPGLDLSVVVDAEHRVVALSEGARALGRFPEDMERPRLADLVAPEDLDRVLDACEEARRDGVSQSVAFSFRDGSGQWRVTSAVVEDRRSDLAVAGLRVRLGTQVLRPLRSTLLEGVTRFSTEAIVVLGRDWSVVDCSPGVRTVFGVEPEAVLGRTFGPDNVGPESRRTLEDAAARVADAPAGASEVVRYQVPSPGGSPAWIETRLTNLFEDPLVRGLLATSRVVTEEHEALEELRRRADRDPITGLPNRVAIEQALAAAIGEGADRPVLLVDLDGFKQVNDMYGHLVGDDVLHRVSQRLSRACGPRFLGRFGSDEFVVLADPDDDPQSLVAALQDAVARPLDGVAAAGWQLGLSGGSCSLAPCPEPGEALRRADVALAQAKGAGRSVYVAYDGAMDAARAHRRRVGQEVRRALADGQFEMRFEPIVDLADGRLVSCESLVRWRHPARGVLAPEMFMDITEDEGLQGDLDLWVAEQVVMVAADWARAGYRLGVAMNVSAQGLARGFADALGALCERHDLAPERLTVELMESIRPQPELLPEIERLVHLGVGLAIDDFGTGYSSLATIHRLRASTVKIDGAFVDGVETDEGSRAIVRASVSIARTFGMGVVAEWVQRDAQRQALLDLGVDEGQGSLFGGAVTAGEFERRHLARR